jgi:hypothetical protein
MDSGEVRSDGEDGRGGRGSRGGRGGARRCTARTTTSDGAFEAAPQNTTIKLSQRWGVAHPRGASDAATGGEGNSATRARIHDDHRAMTTMIIIALAPPAAQNNKQQSTKDGLYEVDATGGQREGAGELRSGGDYGRGRRRARWATTITTTFEGARKAPLLNNQILYTTATTTRTRRQKR